MGNCELVELLIARCADLHAKTLKRLTALECAVNLDNTSIVHALILAGVDSRVLAHLVLTDRMRTTIAAAEKERIQTIRTTLENISKHKKYLGRQQLKGLNAMLLNAVVRDDLDTITKILELGVANLETRDIGGNTLLHLAVSKNHLEIARQLLAKKAKVNAIAYGDTPLTWARSPEMASLLLKHGARRNKLRYWYWRLRSQVL